VRLTSLCAASLLLYNLYALDRPTEPRPLDDHAALLDPIQLDNLTLIPIVTLDRASDRPPADDVLSLDEAMAERLLAIRELPGGRVDALSFGNAADRPVFVLAGELILGGKQDRVIAANAVIAPHSTQTLAVRCVEHSRWTGDSDGFVSAGRLAHDRLRGSAAYADQEDVWDEVARANAEHFTTNATDTYRDLAELQPATTARLEARVDDALAALPEADRARMIGYAVAYNGEVAAVDRFRSPALFGKLERKLLRAYLAEAREQPVTSTRAPCSHAVASFIANAEHGEAERVIGTAASTTMIQRGTRTASSQVVLGDRHLYSNYLGNVRVRREPARQWGCERHLYPGYLGNHAHDSCWQPTTRPGTGRLHRDDSR